MSMTDLQNDRAAMNAAIENYKTVLAGFKANDGTTQTDVDVARTAAEQAGKTYADRIQTERKANPGLVEDDFFSNPTAMSQAVRDDVSAIMLTGTSTRGMVWLVQTDKDSPGNATVSLNLGGYTGDIDWGDGTVESFSGQSRPEHTYATAGEYRIVMTGTATNAGTPYTEDENWLVDVEQWGTDFTIGSWDYTFRNRKNFSISATDEPTTPSSPSMARMFYGASFTGTVNLSHWDVSSIVNMGYMFYGTSGMSADLSGWDVSNVTTSTGFASTSDIPAARLPTF